MFADVTAALGAIDIVVYNASARARGGIAALDAGDARQTLMVCAFAGFLVERAAARAMAGRGSPAGRRALRVRRIGALRVGQVRAAWSCAEPGART
ncbi:hypothetical protein [Sphingomonas sp. PAMC 26605]|uniref:hypothetical protein n=1 Tax=Sphingomonas sp. PAMC 26605 TaxID=1112214 RepID=UPI003FA44B90